ncbi:MAG: O-antigen ligase family protein [Pseudomonadota bacterium]
MTINSLKTDLSLLAAVVLLVWAVVVIPFGRAIEIPLGILSVFGVVALLRFYRADAVSLPPLVPWPSLVALYAAFVLPMLLSLPDAVALEKSTITTVGTLRYLLLAVSLLWLVQSSASPEHAQRALLNSVALAVTVCILVWCCDGLVQFLTGRNALGYGLGEGYVNGLFGDDDNIKFGVTVALLSPIALLYALREWGLKVFLPLLMLILLMVMLSGKRAAWIALAAELSCLFAYYLFRGRIFAGRLLIALSLVAVVLVGAYFSSDWVQQRSDVLVEALDARDYASLNQATGKRLPIWQTAVRMGQDNWVNGVGPRGFRFAYAVYADADDHWAAPGAYHVGSRASHAHQLILDLWAETGVVGILSYGLMLWVLWRCFHGASPAARSRALPYALALVGTLFPINTHTSWYSSAAALQLWLLLGLFLFAMAETIPPDTDA